MRLAGGHMEAVVGGAIPRNQPLAALARPLVTHAGEELAALAGVRVDRPHVVIRSSELRPPRVGLADVLQGVRPPVQELGARHEIGPEDDGPRVVQVPHGKQRPRVVAPLRNLLLRNEPNVLRMPDLKPRKLGFGIVSRVRLVLRPVLRLPAGIVAGRVAGVSLIFLLHFLVLLRGLGRTQAEGDHAAVIGPLRRAVADDFERVREAGGVRVEDQRLHGARGAVEVAPRENIVRAAVGGGVVAGAERGEIHGVVAPAQPPVDGTGGVGGAQEAGGGVVHLHAVAHVRAGGDGEREQGTARAPRHLAHVAEGRFRPR